MDEEFDPRVSLVLERSLVELDRAVLSGLVRNNTSQLRKGLSQLESMISEEGGTGYLDKLCAAGCDRRIVLWLLHPFSPEPIFPDARWSNKPGPKSIESFFGITSKELDSLTNKLHQLAAQLETVTERPEFGSLLKISKPLYPVWRLPQTLRTCERVLCYGARHFAGNSHIYDNIAKARLTTYVETATVQSSLLPKRKSRNIQDEHIAALISSVLGDEDLRYDATAHRMWRKKHHRRLSMLDPDFKLDELFATLNIS